MWRRRHRTAAAAAAASSLSTKARPVTRRLELRVGQDMPHSLPASVVHQLATVEQLTIWIRGDRLQGNVVAIILAQCQKLQSLDIYRKDNDWDAQNTRLTWNDMDDECLAKALQNNAFRDTLRSFSLTDFKRSTPIHAISTALATLPQLSALKMSAYRTTSTEDDYATAANLRPPCTFSVNALEQLLSTNRSTYPSPLRSLRLLGILPPTADYVGVFNRAYWNDYCQVHIFLHFAATRRPGSYPYYLRQVMELNQKGRGDVGPGDHAKLLDLMQHVIRASRNQPQHHNTILRQNSSGLGSAEDGITSSLCFEVDGLYHLLRDNPWVFDQATLSTKTNGSKGSVSFRLGRLRRNIFARIRSNNY